jgi:hypothetical protein
MLYVLLWMPLGLYLSLIYVCEKFRLHLSAISVNAPFQFFTVNNFMTIFEVFCWLFRHLATAIDTMVPIPSGVEEGWINGPILQTNAAHLTKMKHWSCFNKEAPAAWYSYTWKIFGSVQCLPCRHWNVFYIGSYSMFSLSRFSCSMFGRSRFGCSMFNHMMFSR